MTAASRACDARGVTARPMLPLLLALLLPSVVHADETNPAAQACVGKANGAPCATERIVQSAAGKAEKKTEPGSCQPDECCELDYSSGVPPKSTCGPCLVCKPGGAPAGTGTAQGGGPEVEPPRAGGDDPPATTPNDKRGCSVAGKTKAERPWWLLGLVVLGARRGVSRRTPSRRPTSRR